MGDMVMYEELKLVDEYCSFIGKKEKMEVHKCGDLHEAVSIVIFNEQGKILIQKRNDMKYHSGGKWANSCCTHVRVGEIISEAVIRCMKEELGIYVKMFPWFDFIYKSLLDHGMTENEYDHVFWGIAKDIVVYPNNDEVQDVKWITIEELLSSYKEATDFAPWFQHICSIIENIHSDYLYEQKECYRVRKLYLKGIPSLNERHRLINLNNVKELYSKIEDEVNQLCNGVGINNIQNIIDAIQYLFPSKIVLEQNIAQHEEEIDFSICIPKKFLTSEMLCFEGLEKTSEEDVDKWKLLKKCICYIENSDEIEEVWLEYDNCQGLKKHPVPCIFYDTSHLLKTLSGHIQEENQPYGLLGKVLTIGDEQDKKFRTYIDSILNVVSIYQFGLLLARGETKKIRIYTKMFPFSQIKEVLACLRWEGNIENLLSIGEKYNAQSVDLSVTYDFETGEILDDIGLSIYVLNSEVMQVLYDSGYIDDKKLKQYCKWNYKQLTRTMDNIFLMYVRKFGYLKATFDKDKLVTIKSYLYYSQYFHEQNKEIAGEDANGQNN